MSKFSFLSTLSINESYISPVSLSNISVQNLFFLFYCNLIGLLILNEIDKSWVKSYIKRTNGYGNFDKNRVVSTDLYILIYTILGNNVYYKQNNYIRSYNFSNAFFLTLLINIYNNDNNLEKKLFSLERKINLKKERLKTIRRRFLGKGDTLSLLKPLINEFSEVTQTSEVLTRLKKYAK